MKPSLNQYKKIKEFSSDHRDKKMGNKTFKNQNLIRSQIVQ